MRLWLGRRSILPVGLLVACVLLTTAARAQDPAFPSLSDTLDTAQKCTFGECSEALEFIRAKVRDVQLNPVARNEVASALADRLDDAASTFPFKRFVCKQLYIIGGADQIDALVPLLGDPDLAHLARYALEAIPSDGINDALWEAIDGAENDVAAGLAATLAARGGPEVVERLTQLLNHGNAGIVRVALIGLGKQGGAAVENALRGAEDQLPESTHTEYYEALLACAESYQASANRAAADRLYQDLLAPDRPERVRLAAYSGLVALRGAQAAPLVVEQMKAEEMVWVRAAMAHVRRIGGPAATALFAQQLAAVPPGVQVMLLGALADRGDPTALDRVVGGLNSTEPSVRLATIDAIGMLGDETTAPVLLDILARETGETAKRARASLVRVADAGVNAVLLARYDDATAEMKIALHGIFADRRAKAALPALLETANTASGDMQHSAFAAIGVLADTDDVPAVAALLYEADTDTERDRAAEALTQSFRRIPASEERAGLLRSTYSAAPTATTQATLLGVLRALGDDRLLPLVQRATEAENAELKDAAIRALAGWPATTPRESVYALARDAKQPGHRQAALDGYIRMLRLVEDAPIAERVAGFQRALDLAAGPGTIRAILAGLSDLESTAALDIVEQFLDDSTLRKEAAAAAGQIRRKFYRVTASTAPEVAPNVADDDIRSTWATPGQQQPGQWIEIDMFRPATITGVVLDASRSRDAYPRQYRVYVYNEDDPPGTPVASGEGTAGITTVTFSRPVTGQLLRIEQTGSTEETPWVIHEIRVQPH